MIYVFVFQIVRSEKRPRFLNKVQIYTTGKVLSNLFRNTRKDNDL